MCSRLRALSLVVVFAFLPMAGMPTVTSSASELSDSIESIVREEVRYDLFSGAILVAGEGEVIYSGAFGLENREQNIPNKLSTKFNLGSIGKTFTAVLTMQLVETGEIRLSDTVDMYLPDFPSPEKSEIRIVHLLTHSSGLGNYFEHEDYESGMHSLRRIDDALALVYEQELLFQPGEKYHYSNSGMLVLGAIIESVTGTPYRQVLKERVLIPAGMSDSGIFYPEEAVPDRAIGYTKVDEDSFRVETEREFPAFSDGGLYSTVEDMLMYDMALRKNALLKEETKELMFSRTGPSDAYALGWEVGAFMGERFVGHVGGCYGFAADFMTFPDKGIMVIVLSNYTDTGLDLAAKIRHLVLTDGRSDIPPATRYDFSFKKGRNLSEFQKKHEEAVKYFDRNIVGDEPHMPSLFSAARARIVGRFEIERAIALLDRYLLLGQDESNSTKAAVWWLKGQAYEQLGESAEARGCYETSLEFHPEFERAIESLQKLSEEE